MAIEEDAESRFLQCLCTFLRFRSFLIMTRMKGQKVFHSDIIILKGQLVTVEADEETQSPIVPKGAKDCAEVGFSFEIWLEKREEEELVETIPYRNFKSRFVAVLKLGRGANQIRFFDKKTGTVFDEFELNYCPVEANNKHYVRVLHVISAKVPKDKEKIDDVALKLNLGLSLVQTLFAEKLYENGFDRRSFKLSCQNGEVFTGGVDLFEISMSPEEIAQLSTSNLWEYIAKEIRSREDTWDEQCKYVAFVANSWKVHYEHSHNNNGHSTIFNDSGNVITDKLALGGGGLAIIGTSYLDVWPTTVAAVLDTIFSNRRLWTTELENCAARFGAVEKTEGSLYGTSLGSVMHELGHVFSLGHTDRGLMGTEFNRIDTCLAPVLSYPPVSELFRSKLGSDLCPLLRPKVGLPNSECLSEDFLSIGISCATLLYFHKWFQPKLDVDSEGENSDGESLKVIKNKIVSKPATLVTLQVRDIEDERLLKSWTFIEKHGERNCDNFLEEEPIVLSSLKEFTLAKNHIPIPVCQRGDSNKALVVVEDCAGNLVKSVVSRDSLSESFTVIRRRK